MNYPDKVTNDLPYVHISPSYSSADFVLEVTLQAKHRQLCTC